MNSRSIIEDLLVGGLDDWADAGWVYGRVWDFAETVEGRRCMALGAVAEVLVRGLMVPGDVDDEGHHPWPHASGEAIERITREWLTEWPEDIPTPGAIVWLANTDSGNQVAQAVLAREARR